MCFMGSSKKKFAQDRAFYRLLVLEKPIFVLHNYYKLPAYKSYKNIKIIIYKVLL